VIAAEDTRNTTISLTITALRQRRCSQCTSTTNAPLRKGSSPCWRAGQSVAFVSDAGTPAVSDPGGYLCRR